MSGGTPHHHNSRSSGASNGSKSSSNSQLKSCLRAGKYLRSDANNTGSRPATPNSASSGAVPPSVPVTPETPKSPLSTTLHTKRSKNSRSSHQTANSTLSSAGNHSQSREDDPTVRARNSSPKTRKDRAKASDSATNDQAINRISSSVPTAEERERHFMKISNTLVTQHMTGKYGSAGATQRLLYQHLPTPRERQMFHASLKRNMSYLPMFPEPGEHPSFAMTRYIERVFGPFLTRIEMTRYQSSASSVPPQEFFNSHSSHPLQRENDNLYSGRPPPVLPPQKGEPGYIPGMPMFAPPSQLEQPQYDRRQSMDVPTTRVPPSPVRTLTPRSIPPAFAPPQVTTPNQGLKQTYQTSPPSFFNESINYGNMDHSNKSSARAPNIALHNSTQTSSLPTTPVTHTTTNMSNNIASHNTFIDRVLSPQNSIYTASASVAARSPSQSTLKPSLSVNIPPPSPYSQNLLTPKLTAKPQLTSSITPQPYTHQSSTSRPYTFDSPPPQPLPLIPLKTTLNPAPEDVNQNNVTMQKKVDDVSIEMIVEEDNFTNHSEITGAEGTDIDTPDLQTGIPFSMITEEGDERDDSFFSNDLSSSSHGTPGPEARNSRFQSKRSPTPIETAPKYQKFTSDEMLSPITPREQILYHPLPQPFQSGGGACLGGGGPPCCTDNKPKKKPPTYLQLYVKCERSEPLLQPNTDMDIVTWYRNEANQVTADRTLVVRGTVSLYDLIRGLIHTFGLLTHEPCEWFPASTSPRTNNGTRGNGKPLPPLGCYEDLCLLSDIKSTTSRETYETHLIPLPIPGFCYRYVDRPISTSERKDGSTKGTKSKSKQGKSSSLLATNPTDLQQTLAAQLLDKPVYSTKVAPPDGERTRLALVYCAPKREAFISPRTQRGVLPETLYHFQIMLEGIVEEHDLTSSFQTQTEIRCVGATGGVQGGNVIDTEEEINELNRQLWGERPVIGLVSSTGKHQNDLDKIIDLLGIPLFDNGGNQSLKEFVVDKYVYHVCSGNLTLDMAKKTQETVGVMQGTTEWFAKQVEQWAKSFTQTANACVEEDLLCAGDEFDAAVSRAVSNNSSKGGLGSMSSSFHF